MFHVERKIMTNIFTKILITLLIAIIAQFCNSQKTKDFSIGIGSDISTENDYNNLAASIRMSYFILDRVRVVPSFSIFLNKEKERMNTFSLDINYLIQNEIVSRINPIVEKDRFFIYPIAGFYLIRYDNGIIKCRECSSEQFLITKSFQSFFGFDFGLGAEFKFAAKTSKFFKKTSLFWELKYIDIGKLSRPIFSSGLFYNF